MLRRLFTLFSALSLLLCVAAAALWVRSYWEGYGLYYATRPPPALLTWGYAARGGLWVGRMESRYRRPGWSVERFPAPPGVFYDSEFPPGVRLGFGYIPRSSPQAMYGIVAPLWFLTLATAAAPAWHVVVLLRRRRRRLRQSNCLCPNCGYDLRATPGRCPECGRAPAEKVA